MLMSGLRDVEDAGPAVVTVLAEATAVLTAVTALVPSGTEPSSTSTAVPLLMPVRTVTARNAVPSYVHSAPQPDPPAQDGV